MRQIAAALVVLATALPLAAQEEEGGSAMERGLRLFMDGLMQEMEPALRDLEGLAEGAVPFLLEMQRSLAEVVDDFDAYEAPEIQPNGDIIIRRKEPLQTPFPEIEPNEDGSFDL